MSLYNNTVNDGASSFKHLFSGLFGGFPSIVGVFYNWNPYKLLTKNSSMSIILILRSVLVPGVSLFAIASNVTSIVILTRKGFRKCSSILLLFLAVSDVLFLIGVNNVPQYISSEKGFRFSKVINYLFCVTQVMLDCFYTIGGSMASLIPVLITGERLLAIFCPFKVYLILTPRRTIIVVSCLCQIPIARALYVDILCREFDHYDSLGDPVSVVVSSQIKFIKGDDNVDVYELLYQMYSYIIVIIPICLITVGCVVIGLKIVQTSNRRQQLTSGRVAKRGITKTTKTLLMICLLYVLCNGSVIAAAYIIDAEILFGETPVQNMIYPIRDFILCLNCLGECMIYFSANKRYLKTYIMGCGLKSTGRK